MASVFVTWTIFRFFSFLFLIFGEIDEIQILTGNGLVQSEHVISLILKVGSGIKGTGNVEIVFPIMLRYILIGDRNELLLNGSDQVKSGLEFLLGIVCFNVCTHDGDIVSLLTNIMYRGHHHNVNI